MNPQDYATLCQTLGIDRGSLERGFEDEPATVVKAKEAMPGMGKRLGLPPIKGDFTKFGKQLSKRDHQKQGFMRARKHMRPLYESLYNRGTSIEDIAKKVGFHPSTIHKVFGCYASDDAKGRVMEWLTDEEVRVLGWRRNKQ
jgi:hypothetical protein